MSIAAFSSQPAAKQSLAAEGAIASFSSNLNPSVSMLIAPAAEASVGCSSEVRNSKLWLPTFLLFFAIITLAAMKLVIYLGFLVLGILSLRGVRWAYITFVLLGLLYFPASVGFRLNPQPCELTPDISLALYSLTNYAHIILFVLFFLMTSAQFRMSRWSGYAWSAAAGIAMGTLVEVAEGISGNHHCRLRDLIPDAAGVVIGAGVVLLWNGMWRRPQAT